MHQSCSILSLYLTHLFPSCSHNAAEIMLHLLLLVLASSRRILFLISLSSYLSPKDVFTLRVKWRRKANRYLRNNVVGPVICRSDFMFLLLAISSKCELGLMYLKFHAGNFPYFSATSSLFHLPISILYNLLLICSSVKLVMGPNHLIFKAQVTRNLASILFLLNHEVQCYLNTVAKYYSVLLSFCPLSHQNNWGEGVT